jgi:hypothetical protein
MPESWPTEAISVLFSSGKGSEKGFVFGKKRKTSGLLSPEYNTLNTVNTLCGGRH